MPDGRAAYTGQLFGLFALLTVSRPLAISFLACNKNPDRFREDASFLYRCESLAAALADQGHDVRCEHVSRFRWRKPLDAVVLHRPMWSPALWILMGVLRRQGVRVVIDVDDLVFDPDAAPLSPAVLNGRAELKVMARRFERHRRALLKADVITTSTVPLQEELLGLPGLHRRTQVVWMPNAVQWDWRALPLRRREDDPRPPTVLRYLPGTRSHDRDFAHIIEPLVAVLRPRPSVRLEIVGPLACELPLPAQQWRSLPRVHFSRYHEIVSATDINLAPLELTRFTRAKSAVKVIEAAFWGVPTVCSPIPDTLRLRGAGAVICHTPADWVAALTDLLDNGARYRQEIHGLRAAILAQADIARWAREWVRRVMLPQPPARVGVSPW